MLIFIDTEFTDFINCELISIGMVSADGQHEFYGERSDYDEGQCSDFVHEAVLPYLGQIPTARYNSRQLTSALWKWFDTLPGHVQVACDSVYDRDLLWDAFHEGLPENLDRTIYNFSHLIDEPVFAVAVADYHAQTGQPWHHALHDARANRAGWLAWMASQGVAK